MTVIQHLLVSVTLRVVPTEPPIRELSRTVFKTDDPRYRRTRAQICAATRRLLEAGDVSRLTFARIAEAAEVNRSTVHQHYASRHELVADALSGDLARIAAPLDQCPFEGRSHAPDELIQMFAAVRDQRPIFDRLNNIESGLVIERLSGLLTAQLAARFAAGSRPGGFEQVPPEIHARFVAAGLAGLLITEHRDGPAELARQAWQLIAPESS